MSNKKTNLGKADLLEGELRGYPVGKKNVMVACVGAKFKALDDWCNHGGCLLSGGRLEGNTVMCPCHEIGFDLDTGINVTSPEVADDQPAFKTAVENGDLFVLDFEPTE